MSQPSLLARRAGCNAIVALACLVTWAVAPSRAAENPPPTPESEPEIENEVELDLQGPARAVKPEAVEEVVVTAQKRAQDVQDVPISVTALTNDFIQQTGSTSLLQLGRFVPNLSLNQVTDSRSTVIRIRGIGSASSNAGIDPAVGVFLDGIYQGRTGLASSLDLADVERVEVLRGPQGTLFGKNTAAGAISIVTKRPKLNERDAFFETVLGTYADHQIRGTVNIPVVEDRLAVRLTGYWVRGGPFDETWSDGSGRNDTGRSGARLKVLYAPTDDLELLVWADYGTENTACCAPDISSYEGPPNLDVRFRDLARVTGRPLPPLDPFDRMVDANESTTNSTRTISVSSQLDWTVRDHVVTWLSGFRRFDSLSLLDGDFSAYDAVISQTDEQFAQASSELRLTSPSGKRLEWVAGLFFYYQNDDTLGQTGIGPDFLAASALGPIIRSQGGADENGVVSNFDTNTHQTWSYAAFGQATYSLLDSLSLTIGVRLSYERKARVGSQLAGFTAVDAGPFGPDRFADEDFTIFNTSPMASLQWFPTGDIMGFLRVARGFKSGGFNQLRTTGGVDTQFGDEAATDIEAGVRTTWLERMLTLNATAFSTWYNDFQAQAFNGSSFAVTNAGSLRSWGFEADGLVVPHPTTQIGLALGFNPTEYLEFDSAPCTAPQDWVINRDSPLARKPCTQNLAGKTLDNAPRWSASLFGNYERPIGTVPRIDLPVLGYMHADWSYQSEIFLQQDLDTNLVQPGYGQLNLRTGIKSEDGHWELAFGVRNTTNVAYGVVGFDVPIVNGYALINGRPRTFYGSIRYSF